MVDFSIPLARSFALQVAGEDRAGRKILMPTDALGREFSMTVKGWEGRRGLMTGQGCEAEGLKARQVVTILVTNIGSTDATDVRLKARQKQSPSSDPRIAWQEHARGQPVGYDNLLAVRDGWREVDLPLDTLRGMSSPEATRTPLQLVLASVSGTTSLYGTVLVPIEISWTDGVSRQRQTLPIYAAHTSEIRANLLGAEIGSLGSACRRYAIQS